MLLSKLITLSSKTASVCMTFLIIMMVFVVGNNLFVISVNAAPFNSISGVSGTIGVGNGYLTNETDFFGISSDQNIYIITEPTVIGFVEPISHALGLSGIYTLITNGSGQTLRYGMIASDGYLYFIDSEGIKKRKTRTTNTLVSNDTDSITGSIQLLYTSANIYTLYEYDRYLYFIEGTYIKSISLNTYVTSTVVSSGVSMGAYSPLSVESMNGVTSYYYIGAYAPYNCALYKYNGTETKLYDAVTLCGTGTNNEIHGSVYLTTNYIYFNYYYYHDASNKHQIEKIFYKNGTLKSTNFYTVGLPYILTEDINIGGYTTTGLYKSSASAYDTIGFYEIGILNTQSIQADMVYSLRSIESRYVTYYNNSQFTVDFKVAYTANVTQKAIYSHRIELTSPDNTFISSFTPITICEETGTLDWLLNPNKQYNCVAVSHSVDINDFIANPTAALADATAIKFSSISPWKNGTYTVSLYEIPSYALLDSDSFTVLNESGTQTVESTPIIDINSPSNQIAVTFFDGYVSLLGMGVNDVSKLFFSLIIITIIALIGLAISKNGLIAMVLAFAPYIFFTYISYIPKWIFIVVIILIALVSKAFR